MSERNGPARKGLLQLVGGDVLLRHWRPFAFVALATPIAAGIAHFVLPQTFVSESRVLIKLGREFMGPAEQSGRSSAMYRLNEAINSEVEILSSRELAAEVVDYVGMSILFPDLAEETDDSPEVLRQKAAAALLKSLSTTGVAESSVIRVALAHEDRMVAQEALGTLMERFQARHLDVFSGKQLPVADEVVTAVRKALVEAEEARANYREANGIFDADEERSILLRRRDELLTKIEELRASRGQLASGVAPDGEGEGSVLTEDEDLITLRAEEQRLLENYYPSSHAVQAVRAQIVSRERLATERLEKQLSALEADEQRWVASLSEVDLGLRQLETHARSLRELDRSVSFEETRLQEAMGAREAALFDAKLDAGEVTSVVVIDRPTLPLEPLGIGLVAKLFVGAIAGLFLGGSLVILLHLLGREDDEDADEQLQRETSAESATPTRPTVFGSVKLPS
ncbi:GumC family protein [Saltatorellus ferox]|uniref:GumC family protein n=1 Tax=Saltatorellus ferox TaxID=2528018 RepID=UPI003AF39441